MGNDGFSIDYRRPYALVVLLLLRILVNINNNNMITIIIIIAVTNPLTSWVYSFETSPICAL